MLRALPGVTGAGPAGRICQGPRGQAAELPNPYPRRAATDTLYGPGRPQPHAVGTRQHDLDELDHITRVEEEGGALALWGCDLLRGFLCDLGREEAQRRLNGAGDRFPLWRTKEKYARRVPSRERLPVFSFQLKITG